MLNSQTIELWEILVPTLFGDTNKPVSLKHHKEWDKYVLKFSTGLTILKPTKGQWIETLSGQLLVERIIPVRIATTHKNIMAIIDFTIDHYRQKAVMAYKLSNEIIIKGKS